MLTVSASGQKPRILVLSSTFPRWDGDTEPRFVLDLCKRLMMSAEVLVLAPHAPNSSLEDRIEGVRVRRFRYFVPAWESAAYEGGMVARIRSRPIRALQLPFFLVASLWCTYVAVRKWKPDVIHAHWIVPQGLIACLAAGRRIPILCTSHGGDLHNLDSAIFRRLKSWILRRCSRITVVSRSMVSKVEALAPGIPVDVISMGTDLSTLFVPQEHAERDSREILFVGRLVEKKGARYLLEAVRRLQSRSFAIRLTVVGDGPLRQELTEQSVHLGIADAVRFLGSVRHSELAPLYRRAAAAVFPFVVARDGDQEGFGLVVVEAMGSGCPVIASDVPAVRENVLDGVTGWLVPQKDVDRLADAIERCLTDRVASSRMAETARRMVVERFDWSGIAQRYLQALQACIAT